MREHLYRYYSEQYKEMLPVLTIDFVNDVFYILPFDELEGGNQVEIKGVKNVQEYIGYKDKDGNNIYRGDIIRRTTKRNIPSKCIGCKNLELDEVITNGIVEYDETSLCYVCIGGYYSDGLPFGNIKNEIIEIIGNINENPELASELMPSLFTDEN